MNKLISSYELNRLIDSMDSVSKILLLTNCWLKNKKKKAPFNIAKCFT